MPPSQVLVPDISFTTALYKDHMAKKTSPLDIMNTMGDAAHKKAQPPMDPAEPDADDLPKKKSKQAAAINEKKKTQQAPPMNMKTMKSKLGAV